MDPSYNNGVGSQIPQNNPQMSGQPMQQPVMSQQPMMAPQQPISSGTGDIVLSGNDTPKKSHKGIIILIVLVVVLVLAGGGFLLWQNGVFGGNNSQSQTASLKEKYNNYVNYVLWGVESNGKPELTAIGEALTPYFMSLQDNKTALNEYVNKADAKYEALKQAYDEKGGGADIAVLKAYFEDYARIEQANQNKMIKDYITKGADAVREMISEKYTVNNEKYLAEYEKVAMLLDNYTLEMIVNADKMGCLKEGKIMVDCYQMGDADKELMGQKMVDVSNAFYDMKNGAYDMIKALYGELYNGESGNGE